MIFGYKRPVYNDEQCEKQLATKEMVFDKVFIEPHGLPKKRLQLEELLMSLNPGDEVFVHSFCALADSSIHLMEIVKICEKDDVIIHFKKEELNSRDLLSCTLQEMLHHIVEFQKNVTRYSTQKGMEHAKESGKTIGRPKKSDDNIKQALSMYHSGDYTLREIKDETGISKSTLYRYLENMDH